MNRGSLFKILLYTDNYIDLIDKYHYSIVIGTTKLFDVLEHRDELFRTNFLDKIENIYGIAMLKVLANDATTVNYHSVASILDDEFEKRVEKYKKFTVKGN